MDRQVLMAEVARQIAEPAGDRSAMGLVLIRLNHLKQISHTYGFGTGDRVIQTLLERLHVAARPQDLAGHLGGGCFALWLAPPCNPALAELAINRMLELFDEPIVVDGLSMRCKCHGSAALYPEHGATLDALLAVAEKGLAKAKTLGHSYLPEEGDPLLSPGIDFRILENLEAGLDAGEFTLVYQPQIDLANGRVAGLESLLRWDSRQLGRIPPGQFVPLVELTELIVPLTRWTFNTALRDHQQIARTGSVATMSVNVSATLLTHPDLQDIIGDALAIWQTPADRLMVEITETAMINNPETSVAALHRIRALGVRLSIDDFGTGYSSLAYLERLPTDELKIDKSFVDHVTDNVHDEKIVHAVIDLAHTFDMRVVAEGIEAAAQQQLLTDYGCDIGQGYLFSRPLDLDRLLAYLDG